jgi:hypothetical protein
MKSAALFLLYCASACAQFVQAGFNSGVTIPSGSTPVQQIPCTWTSGLSYTCTLGSTPSNSNILIFTGGGSPASTSVTPSSSNAAWVKKGSSNTNRDDEIWCATLSGTPGTTVTVTISGSPTQGNAIVSEWSGWTCTLDGVMQPNNGSSSNPATATLTTTNANDLLIAVLHNQNGTFGGGPTNGFTGLTSYNANTMNAGYLVVSATGNYSTGWSFGSSVLWDIVLVALKQ